MHAPECLVPTFFTDPHFLSAAHTFQDHLFSSCFTSTSSAALQRWLDDVQSGAVHFPWKDEVWELEHHEGMDLVDESALAQCVPVALIFLLYF